jgi:myxalamid-type polyketide synthase MxaB
VGLAAVDAERARNMAALGFEAMAPATALDALGRAMVGSVPQLAIMAFDPDAYRRSLPGRDLPVLSRRRVAAAERADAPAPPAISETLRSAPAEARGELLLEHVRGQVAAVLRLDDPDELDVARGFFTLGMDSLMAVELKNRLQTALGLPLPSTVVFDRPSIAQLVGFLERELGRATPAAAPAGASVAVRTASADAGEIRRLPRHVIEALLADELKQIKGSGEPR